MSVPLSPELEARAQELAARITTRSADAILDMARRLVSTPDEALFGGTEFALRDSAPSVVADAYDEHLGKKGGTSGPRPTAPAAPDPSPSTTTARRRSPRSAAASAATAGTTTAASAAKASTRGTTASG